MRGGMGGGADEGGRGWFKCAGGLRRNGGPEAYAWPAPGLVSSPWRRPHSPRDELVFTERAE